jgi:hypothetical protein
MKRIILLNGKAQSGKDTVYNYFEEILDKNKCHRFAFADYLKEICKQYFYWDGKKDDQGRWLLINVGQILRGEVEFRDNKFIIDDRNYLYSSISYYIKVKKEYKCLFFGDIFSFIYKNITPNKDFWVRYVYNQIQETNYEYNIITDFRFLNEFLYFDKYGIDEHFNKTYDLYTINIQRDNSLIIKDRSENDLINFIFDYIIENNGTLENLKINIEDIIYKIKESK